MIIIFRTILLTLMMTTPVMARERVRQNLKTPPQTLPKKVEIANGIDGDREKFFDDIYEGYFNAIREHRMKDRTPAEDSINKALMEFNYGSNGATESEELLQLPSDEDQQGS